MLRISCFLFDVFLIQHGPILVSLVLNPLNEVTISRSVNRQAIIGKYVKFSVLQTSELIA